MTAAGESMKLCQCTEMLGAIEALRIEIAGLPKTLGPASELAREVAALRAAAEAIVPEVIALVDELRAANNSGGSSASRMLGKLTTWRHRVDDKSILIPIFTLAPCFRSQREFSKWTRSVSELDIFESAMGPAVHAYEPLPTGLLAGHARSSRQLTPTGRPAALTDPARWGHFVSLLRCGKRPAQAYASAKLANNKKGLEFPTLKTLMNRVRHLQKAIPSWLSGVPG